MTETELRFLSLLREALQRDISEDAGFDGGYSESEWRGIFALASRQLLLPTIFERVWASPDAGKYPDLFGECESRVTSAVLCQAARSVDFRSLNEFLRSRGLHPLAVKGELCARLWPMEYHRIFSDDDILVQRSEFEACRDALCEYGLSTGETAEGLRDEITYENKYLRIELHSSLFDSTEDAPDNFNRFFEGIFGDMREVEGFLAMPPHEHMLYLLLHTFKHFLRSGVGVRQLCDSALWAKEYHSEIDWERLYAQCAEVRAAGFAAACFNAAGKYLGIELNLPPVWHRDEPPEPMLEDMLEGGIYGSSSLTRLHSSTVVLGKVKASRTGERSGLLRSIFPPLESMKAKYPYLQKYPVLLPAAWFSRGARYARELSRGVSSPKGSIRLANERLELLKIYDII